MPRAARRYTAKLKFQLVLEALKGEKTPGQITKAYGVHANSVGIRDSTNRVSLEHLILRSPIAWRKP